MKHGIERYFPINQKKLNKRNPVNHAIVQVSGFRNILVNVLSKSLLLQAGTFFVAGFST